LVLLGHFGGGGGGGGRREGGEALFAFRNTGGERVSNKGERGFGKASDRVKAEDHRPQVVVWWGALSKEGEKLGRWKAIIRFRGSGIRNWRLSLNTAYEFQ